jgi:hypothetical protein
VYRLKEAVTTVSSRNCVMFFKVLTTVACCVIAGFLNRGSARDRDLKKTSFFELVGPK